ncbi:sensor histidine kinase [Thalassiella azotivora]
MTSTAPAPGAGTAGSPGPRPPRLPRLSLLARLVAVLLAVLTLALLASSAVALAVLRGQLVESLDDELRTASEPTVLQSFIPGHGRRQEAAPSPYDITLLDGSGVVLEHWRSTSAPDAVPALRLDDELVERMGGRAFTVPSASADGPRWRVIARPVLVRTGFGGPEQGIAAVARPLDGVQDTLDRMRTRLTVVGVVVLAGSAVLGTLAVRGAFRPLRQVEAVATAFGQGDTSRRVANDHPGTEVGRLGASINAMLDSIESTLAAREASETRMRRFVADASHELRTPLAAVRGFAELYRQGAVREEEDVARSFRRIEDESTRMAGLVEDLLLLARLDEQRPLRRDPLDLLVLAGDTVHDASALAPDRAVRLVGLDGDPTPRSAPTVGDDARMRQVLANLLTNALRHTPPGTPVEIGVGTSGGWARWQVVDHGPGIPAADAPRVFERFYRSDVSRSRAGGGGAGLGLAIVDAITRAHGGAARVVPTPGGGATFEVAVPAAPAEVEEPGPTRPGPREPGPTGAARE